MRDLADFQKAFIGPYVNGHMELKGRFHVPFNPAELSVEEAIGIEDVSRASDRFRRRLQEQGSGVGMQYPAAKSSRRRSRGMTTLSVKLFFNTLNDLQQSTYEDVREDIRRFYPYTNTTEKLERITNGPSGTKSEVTEKLHKAQQLYFFWGSIAVAGMLRSMSVNYTMFAPDGKPVRAEVSITIEGFYVGEETVTESTAAPKSSAALETADQTAHWRETYQGSANPRL
ncbi:MAG: hypothetical protein NC543_10115 [bacterium]|nr:hypothetical protein [bacterium]